MIKIALDPGHGLYTPGKETADLKYKEWTLNSNVANYVEEYLKNYNIQIVRLDDRTGNIDVPLNQRLDKARLENVDAIISIHHNAYTGKFGNHTGVETYVFPGANEKSKRLAKLIVDDVSKQTGLRNRGVKENNFYMISLNKNIPQVLVEGGFMDSNIDYKVITSIEGQKNMARGIANAIITFFNLKGENVNIDGEKMVVTANVLNIRSGPGLNYNVVGKVYKNEVYTIIEKKNGFGLLKSKVGWLSLEYLQQLGGKYTGDSIVEALKSIGIDSSFENRKKIAILNGIENYTGTAKENMMLIELFRKGLLKY